MPTPAPTAADDARADDARADADADARAYVLAPPSSGRHRTRDAGRSREQRRLPAAHAAGQVAIGGLVGAGRGEQEAVAEPGGAERVVAEFAAAEPVLVELAVAVGRAAEPEPELVRQPAAVAVAGAAQAARAVLQLAAVAELVAAAEPVEQ